MSVRRQKKSEKILKLIDGVIDEAGVYCNYGRLRRRLHGRWDYKTNFSKAVDNLKRYGYQEVVEIENSKSVRLTDKGRFKIWKPRIEKTWDGKFRLIGFDISEKRKKTRDSLRSALRSMGFKQMQKSLWICPYDVSDAVEEVMDILHLHEEVDYFIADAITNKQRYINMFDLNQEK